MKKSQLNNKQTQNGKLKFFSIRLSCAQNWNIEKEKDRDKEKVVGDRLEKLNEKQSDKELEREIKNKRGEFVGRTT